MQGENRDVARHVHEYYTLITDLEKQLSEGRRSTEEWQEREVKMYKVDGVKYVHDYFGFSSSLIFPL